jgi:DNA-binding transcriptional LysR family regulator
MDIPQLHAFLAVAGSLHFGRASAELRVAQPALSRTIKKLEHEVGERLFDRSTRSVTLSPAGEALVEPAREVLDAHRRATLAVKAAGRGEIGRVRIAYSGTSTHVLVGQLAQRVRQEHPGIGLELISTGYSNPPRDMLLRGQAEIGIGRWDHIPAGISYRVLADEHLVVAIPASHPLAGASAVSMRQLKGEDFVSLPLHTGSILTDRLEREANAAGFAAHIVQVAPDSWTVISLVAAGIGCALTLSSVMENVPHRGVSFVPLADTPAAIQLRILWHTDSARPAVAAVLGLSEVVIPSPEPAVSQR